MAFSQSKFWEISSCYKVLPYIKQISIDKFCSSGTEHDKLKPSFIFQGFLNNGRQNIRVNKFLYWRRGWSFLRFYESVFPLNFVSTLSDLSPFSYSPSVIISILCVLSLSHVQFFGTPWTVPHRAPLSVGFSSQEYWSGLPCPPPGDLSDLDLS